MTLRLRACIAGAALLTLVAVAGAVLEIGSGADLFVLTSLGTGLMFGLTGALLTGLRPANPLGPLLVTAGGALTLEFAIRVYAARDHSAVAAIGLALDPLFFPVPIALLVLLFPDGRLPSRRWRAVPAIGLVLTVVAVVLNLIRPGPISDETFQYDIPWTGVLPAASADQVAGLSRIVTSLGLLLLVLAAGNLIVRLARTTGEDRRRLVPLALAGGLAAGFLLLQPVPGLQDVAVAGFVAAVAVGLPAALVAGALRYRVWDLDQVLVTSIVYGALTVGITAVYVGAVVTFGRVAGTTGPTPALLPSVVATVLVAVLFAPVKERISRTARRMVLGVRATPYEALAALPRQLARTPAPADVLPGTARALALGLGVPAARVRAYTPDVPGHRVGEAWFPAAPADQAAPGLIEVPVWHLGEVVGDVAVRSSPDRPLSPADRRLLADLAAQAGPALRGVILTGRLEQRLAELIASRRRIVTAEARGRRRLERDIHDGAQQHLVALAVSLGAAETDPSALTRARADLDRCIQDLRDLARGIYPPVLVTRGLVAAVKARARAAPASVEVSAGPGLDGARPGEDVELAAYFAVLEALQNAMKHAPGAAVTVRFDADDGWLRFTVADNGPGFDPAQPGDGTGLTGIADRLGAVGGTVEIAAAPGAGVRVEGRLPLTTPG
ncbi:ATP-binding protein [Actinoplanes sp. M2I2]|uniref:sensor histidine kinase n=1 Tax=Actinoplanes sp. M2I2 TaxID=1734444 RepID=UPI0020227406|nr:ATP-binding protein [Actinoplanes sp. M2I2]